ncbi:hypothetical protein RU639_006243 [Aspergillus parasiticus]
MDKFLKAISNESDRPRLLDDQPCEKHKLTKRCRDCCNLSFYSQPDTSYHFCPEQLDVTYSILNSKNDCQFCELLAKVICHYYGYEFWSHMVFKIDARHGYPLVIMHYSSNRESKRIEVFREIESRSAPWSRAPFIGGGSVLMDHSDDQGVYDFILECLSDCTTTHEHCDARNPVPLPSRLLQVSDQNRTCRLVEPTKNQLGTYTTLSYCWGNGNPLKLTKGLYNSFKNGISWNDLPQLFRDAMRIANRLGVSYIWIDSLCIVQDDRKDWEMESGKMASIYQNAYITIVAASAPDPDTPILRARGQPMEKAEFKFEEDHGARSYLFSRCISAESIFGLESPKVKTLASRQWPGAIYQRGWTFQEDLLSRRTIHYLPDRVVWECWMSQRDERQLPRHPSYREQNRCRPKPLTESWPELLGAYSPRELTHISDTLPALSGIAHMISERTGDEYLAGLWRSSLVVSLAWFIRVTPIKLNGDPAGPRSSGEGYIAPSWSWASAAMKNRIEMFPKHKDERILTVLIDARVDVKGKNKFGEVSGGFMRLCGPVCEVRLCCDGGRYDAYAIPSNGEKDNRAYPLTFFPDMNLCVGDGLLETGAVVPTICRKYADLQTSGFGPGINAYYEINMIALFEMEHEIFGLVIGRSPRVPGAYERLGLVECPLGVEERLATSLMITIV